MSRWRPPRPKSSPYITVEGYQTLEVELKQLWERRKHVTAALSAAAAEGDRSENAEYIYRKKELREIDRRIHYLQKRLPSLTVVSEKPGNQNQVFFGAWVTLETMDGDEITYRIVGADEIDTSGGLISLDSPLAKGLLKKNLDDEVVIRHGDKETRYYIVAINYQP
jgi:transcription elongation factor GreB